MSRFLRFCALLSVLFFSTNLFAAGYTCPTTKNYTSCSANYYRLKNTSNSYYTCTACPSNSTSSANNTATGCTCKTGYSVGGTVGGATTGVTSACSPILTYVTLDQTGATTTGTLILYAKYGATSLYSNTARTTTISKITVPQKKYTVTYNANGGSVSTTSATSNCPFAGYGTYINADGTITTAGINAANSHYTQEAYSWGISWGTCGSVTLPTPTRTGYTFKGWSTSSTATSGSTGSYTPTSNVTLYATWSPNTYKVTLDKQSGTGGTSEYYYQYKTLGSCYYYTTSALTTCIAGTQGITITVPTRTGYTFGGYYTGTNGTGTQYVNASGGTINNLYSASAANITLYAKWTAKSYTCAAGKYLNGTTCTTCTVDYYCPGGTWTYNGGIQGRNACSSYRANTNTNGATGASSSSSCVCSSGRYLSGSTCTACAVGTYKSAHSNATGCTVASSGYYVSTTGATYQTACTSLGSFYTASDSGRDAASDCYGTTTPGKYIATANTSTQTPCSYGHFCSATKIYYGSTGGREECPGVMVAESGSEAKTDCFVELSGGFYLKAGNGGGTQCPANSFCSGGKFYFNADSDQGRSSCTANSSSPAGSDAKADCVCNAGYGGSGASGSCTYCSAGTYKTSAGNTSCSTCSANSYCTGGTHIATCSSSDASYPYSDSGTGSSNYCYASKTNTGSQITCSKPANSYSHTCNSCTPGTCSWRDYKGATDTTCTPTNCTQTATVTGCAASYYKSGNACYACSGLANGFYPNSNAGNSSGTSACFTDSLSGKIIKTANASTTETCGAGYYKAAHTVNYGSTSGGCSTVSAGCYSDSAGATSSCPKSCSSLGGGLYKNSAAGSDAATDCYFTTTAGKYLAASTNTAQTTCEAKYYCPATTLYYPNTGSKLSCPDPTSSTYKEAVSEMGWLTTACPTATASNSSLTSTAWQSWSNTGLSAITQCPAVYNVSTPCANFQIEGVKYNSTTGRYDSDVGGRYSTAVKAGYYFTERYSSTYCNTTTNNMLYKTAAKCPANSYCPGATVPKCSSGTYAETYGSYACTSLGSFYTTSAAGATANTSCYGTTTPGNYIATKKSGQVTCAAGGYCPGSVAVYYDSTGGRTACSAGTKNASTGSSSSSACTACAAGTYSTGGASACTNVKNGCYADGTGSTSDCPKSCPSLTDGYSYVSGTGWTAYSSCKETKAYSSVSSNCDGGALTKTATSATAWGTATSTLTAKAGYGVSGSGDSRTCSACGGGKWSAAGSATCSNINAGCYGTSASSACPASCAKGTYSTGGAASCTNVKNGCYADGTGSTSDCPKSCPGMYVNSQAGSDAATDCYIELASKVYLASASSTSTTTCTAGYYCPGGNFYYSSSATNQGRSSCTGATYSAAGAASCSNCPSGYTANTANNKTLASQCQISCAAGTRVAAANATCTSPAGAWFSGATTTNYGQVSLVNYCMAGYTSSSTSASGHDAKSDCTQTIAGGKYVPATTISARYVKVTTAGSTANAGSHVVEIQAFASADGTGTNLLSGKGGVSGSNMTAATDGSWARGNYASGTMVWDMGSTQSLGSLKFALYTDGRTYSDVTIAVSTDNSTWTTVMGPIDIKTQNVSTATGELVVLSAAPASCVAGTARASASLALGSTNSCAACSGRTKYSAAGASSCSDVGTGYFTTGCNSSGNNCTGRTQCSGSTYCEGGVQKNCPSAETNWTQGTGTGWSAVTSCFETRAATNVSTYCSAGQLKKNATSTTAWGTASVSTAFQARAGSIVSGTGADTTCTQCSGAVFSAGGSATSCTACPAQTSGWTRATGTGWDSYTDCYQTKAATAVSSLCESGQLKQIGASATTWATATVSATFKADPGAYVTGSGASTTCSTCTANYYCPGGTTTRQACSALTGVSVSGGSYTSAAGSDASTDCKYTAPSKEIDGCASVTTNTVTYSGSAWPATTYSVTADPGYYIANNGKANATCTICAKGNYCTGGTAAAQACPKGTYGSTTGLSTSACSGKCAGGRYGSATGQTVSTCSGQCTAGYYCPEGSTSATQNACGAGKYSSAGSDASSDCGSISAGCYGTSASSACPAVCGENQYSTSGSSSCSSCPTDYKNSGTTAASHAGSASCIITVSAGKYIGTAGDNSTNWDTCAGGTYKASHTVAYGSTSSCSTCSAGYYCPQGAGSQTACGSNAKYSSSGAAACSDVSSGYYSTGGTSTTRTGQTKCEAGNYCSGGVKTACGGGKYSSAGATSCSNITAGCYGTSASSSCPAVCGENQYSASGSSSCSSCPTDYKNSGTTAASHAGSASCIITVSAGKYIGTAGDNSTNWDTCAGGTYKASHTVAYGSTSSCSTCSAGYYCPQGAGSQTACGSNAKYSSSGAAACSDVSSGYYSTGGTSTTRTGQTKCEAGNYCSGGVKTACGGGKYSSAGATSCSNITAGCYGTSASSSCPAVCGENQYSTSGSSSCSSCPTDYKNSGTTAASHAGSASCIITVSAGKYIGTAGDNSTNWDTCAGGTYKASHTVAYGSTSSCSTCSAGYYCPQGAGSQTACGSNAKYSSSGAAACSDVSSGYYSTGGTSTTRTGQTKCEAGNYCSGGVKTACGGGKYSSAGATSCSNITAGCYGTSATSACPAVCGENKYSTSGSSSCSSCPTDYKNSGTSASSHAGSASCIITVSAGKYIGTAGDNSTNWDTCAGGTYKASHTVAYGSTSSCSTCSAGYYCPQGAGSQTACATGSYTNAAGKSACTACGAGKTTSGTGKTSCDATCANATGAHSWATPSWSANSVTNLCKVTACNANTYYTAKTATGYTNTCSSCGANSSTSAGNTSTTCACLAGYTVDGKVGGTATTTSAACQLISNIACAIGQYVPAKATACSDCTAGYYCPSTAKTYSYSTSIQGRTACSPGTYQPSTGKTSCVDASAGYYVGSSAATSQTACTGATYAANTKQTACTVCPTATNDTANVVSYGYWNTSSEEGNHTTRAGCNATFKAKTLDDGTMSSYSCYVDSGADTYGVDGTSKTCWVNRSALKCNGGYYNTTFNNSSTATQYTVNKTLTNLYANVCTNAGAGYWSANDSLTRTACATGLTTIGYGTAANEADDCGRKLHAGNNVIYLRSAARTSPSLRVKIGDTTFFGALSTSLSGALKVDKDGTKYSVVNDWQ